MSSLECHRCPQAEDCGMYGQPDLETPIKREDIWAIPPGTPCFYFVCEIGWLSAIRALRDEERNIPLVPFKDNPHKPFVPGRGRFIARKSQPIKDIQKGSVYVLHRGEPVRIAKRPFQAKVVPKYQKALGAVDQT